MEGITIYDYTLQLEQIIENQNREIELLEQQVAILLEQVNGFSLITNYLHSMVGISICVIGAFILWQVLSKWFFRGV